MNTNAPEGTPTEPSTVPASRPTARPWPAGLTSLVAVVAAFSTYFCMYAFRKPFSAATYDGLEFDLGPVGTINGKTTFVIAQIIGYAISKYVGIKVCAEVTRRWRAPLLVGLVFIAHIALLAFATAPSHIKILAIFASGLPLGMIWGLVVLYLEGRRTSELLLVGLSASFIIASGVVKDVGLWLMRDHAVTEYWMPITTAALFIVPLVVSVFILDRVPDPDHKDIKARSQRTTMDDRSKFTFIKALWPGLLPLLIAYFLLTAYRDIRDNYGIDIFNALGYAESPGIFTISETWVAFSVLATLALLNLIRNNRLALIAAHAVMLLGIIAIATTTWLLIQERISGLAWMIGVGIGSYLAYVPYGAVLFERMVPATRVAGTAVFAIYIADAIGYTGSVTVQLVRDFGAPDAEWLDVFIVLSWLMASVGLVGFLWSTIYFWLRTRKPRQPPADTHPTNSTD